MITLNNKITYTSKVNNINNFINAIKNNTNNVKIINHNIYGSQLKNNLNTDIYEYGELHYKNKNNSIIIEVYYW